MLRAVQPHRPASEIIGRDAFTSGIDIDFEDDSAPEPDAEGSEGGDDGLEARGDGQRQDSQRQDSQRQDGQRQDNPRNDGQRQDYRGDNNRGEYRDRRPEFRRDEYRPDNRPDGRQDGRQDARPDNRQDNRQGGRQDSRPEGRQDGRQEGRYERPRDDRPRDDRGYRGDRQDRYEGRGDRQGQPSGQAADPLPVVEPEATPLTAERRDDTATLRSQDGGFSPAPAFLQSRIDSPPETTEPAAAEPRRRRGRPPRRVEGETATAEPTPEEA